MNKQYFISAACDFLVALTVSVLLFAQTGATSKHRVDQNKAMLQALQALTVAQERQAEAWEKLGRRDDRQRAAAVKM